MCECESLNILQISTTPKKTCMNKNIRLIALLFPEILNYLYKYTRTDFHLKKKNTNKTRVRADDLSDRWKGK